MTREEVDELLVRCAKELEIDFRPEEEKAAVNPHTEQMNEIKKWIFDSITTERRRQLQKKDA